MDGSEYWNKFDPVPMEWHFIYGYIYLIVGIFGLILNFMVLYYLIRYLIYFILVELYYCDYNFLVFLKG
jgi:hypothetical protein